MFHSQQDPGWEFTEFLFFDLPLDETTTAEFAGATVDQFVVGGESTSVPEPSTVALLSIGLLLMVGSRWHKRRPRSAAALVP